MRDSLVEVLDSQPLKVPVSSLLAPIAAAATDVRVCNLPDCLCVSPSVSCPSLPQKFPSWEEVGGSS